MPKRAGPNRGTWALLGDSTSGDRPDRRALILVENLSVPFDRRVWQECRTLRDAGWEVDVIC
ncbi:glycosyltransferase WbuB, partial [Streptomyces sp. NPDC057927]